jgi:hypothetical protein
MFCITPTTYYIVISIFLALFIIYCYSDEHFSTIDKKNKKNKKKVTKQKRRKTLARNRRMVEKKKRNESVVPIVPIGKYNPPKRKIIPSKVVYKRPSVIQPQTNTNIISNVNNVSDTNYNNDNNSYPNYYSNYTCPNYWYDSFNPSNWSSWFGFDSDPILQEPILPVSNLQPIIDIGNNCHKKCIDRYANDYGTNQYLYKVDNCINEFCY